MLNTGCVRYDVVAGRGAVKRVDNRGIEHVQVVGADAERLPDKVEMLTSGHLVARDAYEVDVDEPKVDAELTRGGYDRLGPPRYPGEHGVEEALVHDLDTATAQPTGQDLGEPVHALRDAAQAVGTVPDGVHRGHHGEEHLRGADVGRGLLAADVLLARLQRQAVGGGAVCVDGYADQPTRQGPLEPRAYGHVARVRSAISERDAEALRRTDGDVGTRLARRSEQAERQQIGGDCDERTALVRRSDDGVEVADSAGRTGVLHDDAEEITLGQAADQVGDDDLDAERLGARLQDSERLRKQVGVDDQDVGLALDRAAHDRHRLGDRGALVEQRGVGGRQTGEVGDDGLEVEQCLEPTLRDLGLVGRVGGVPGRVLEHIAQHDRRGVRVVVAEPDHLHEPAVAPSQGTKLRQCLGLGGRLGQVERAQRPDRLRDCGGGQLVERAKTDGLEHLRDLGVGWADMPRRERRCCLELGQGDLRRAGHGGSSQGAVGLPPPLSRRTTHRSRAA